MKNNGKANKKQGKNFIKYLIGIFMVVATVGISFGSWLFLSQSTAEIIIVSESPENPVYFSMEFKDIGNITASSNNFTVNTTAILFNENGAVNLVFSTIETMIDLEDDCNATYPSGIDCTYNYSYFANGEPEQSISDGESMFIPAGQTRIKAYLNCRQSVCSGTYTTEIKLS